MTCGVFVWWWWSFAALTGSWAECSIVQWIIQNGLYADSDVSKCSRRVYPSHYIHPSCFYLTCSETRSRYVREHSRMNMSGWTMRILAFAFAFHCCIRYVLRPGTFSMFRTHNRVTHFRTDYVHLSMWWSITEWCIRPIAFIPSWCIWHVLRPGDQVSMFRWGTDFGVAKCYRTLYQHVIAVEDTEYPAA
jgi:hypothetical protein